MFYTSPRLSPYLFFSLPCGQMLSFAIISSVLHRNVLYRPVTDLLAIANDSSTICRNSSYVCSTLSLVVQHTNFSEMLGSLFSKAFRALYECRVSSMSMLDGSLS